MNDLQTIKEVKELASKRNQLIAKSKESISNLEQEIETLVHDQKNVILGMINVKRFLGKKKSEEEIEQQLLETKIKLENEQNKLKLLEASSIKDNLSLDRIYKEMNEVKGQSEERLKKLENEAIELHRSYLDKKRLYIEMLEQTNNSILSTNNYLDQIFNDDVFYRDGSYWDRKTGVRVNRQRPGIHTIMGNSELCKKEG
ncbi:hypothetical protein [Enterococcus sp. DIV0187]|uniref:hypothetical protein n=1 Tax=Enterococcus sp. DIV0187 TaxID=2774644 RepID=UPI003F1EC041